MRPHPAVADLAIALLGQAPSELPHALVVLSGLPGSGKSCFAHRIAERTGLPLVSSDDVRRRLIATRTYSAGESALVYDTCRRIVEVALRAGGGAVVDATNLREQTRRDWKSLADRWEAVFALVMTHASQDVTSRRLAKRTIEPDPAHSEATYEVYERLRPTMQPTRLHHVDVDTEAGVEEAVDRVIALVRHGH